MLQGNYERALEQPKPFGVESVLLANRERANEFYIFCNYFILVSKRLNGLQVVDSISNDQVGSLFIWSLLVLETFFKLNGNPVSKNNEWHTSKCDQ